MTDLIAWVSSGKGTIAHVKKVMEGDWEKTFLLTTKEFKNECPSATEVFIIDNSKTLSEMIQDIKDVLQNKIQIMETAVNLISGDGKEHMALMSALLQLGCGIKLVAYTKEGIKEV